MKTKNAFLPKSVRLAVVVGVCLFLVGNGLCAKVYSQFEGKKAPRMLAPGVMKTIKPDIQFSDTFVGDDKEIIELTSESPEFHWATTPRLTPTSEQGRVPNMADSEYDWAKLRFPAKRYADKQPTSCLEFQFKVPRITEMELPTSEGKIEKTPVWYMIYSVTNKKWAEEEAAKITDLQVNLLTANDLAKLETDVDFGSTLFIDEAKPGCYNVKPGESTITFIPQFFFASESLAFPKTNQYVVPEQVIPLALPAIIKQEDPNRTFETTVSMADREIKPGETVWGIAMWKGIDPEVKDFSIFVSGLSNAYHWEVNAADYKPGEIGSGYSVVRKTLRLNFWAPGAADHLLNKEVQYGTRRAILPQKADELPPVDFEWVYR